MIQMTTAIRCINCGAPLDGEKCPYCKTINKPPEGTEWKASPGVTVPSYDTDEFKSLYAQISDALKPSGYVLSLMTQQDDYVHATIKHSITETHPERIGFFNKQVVQKTRTYTSYVGELYFVGKYRRYYADFRKGTIVLTSTYLDDRPKDEKYQSCKELALAITAKVKINVRLDF